MFSMMIMVFILNHGANVSDTNLPLVERLSTLKLSAYQGSHNAALAIYDLNTDQWYRFNKSGCVARSTPCSTFKIFNSLAGLQAQVLQNRNTTFRWNQQQQPIKSWQRDHDLASAFKNSVVWYYRQVAREVGSEKMQNYLDQVNYGNRNISGGIDQFWLGSSFLVSPNEQVILLKRLYRDELPFSTAAMRTVRSIMVDVVDPDSILSGKTGSDWHEGSYRQGWYVGHLRSGDFKLVFASTLIGPGAHGQKARAMMLRIFRDLALMPE